MNIINNIYYVRLQHLHRMNIILEIEKDDDIQVLCIFWTARHR
jgi:hypothetical protein